MRFRPVTGIWLHFILQTSLTNSLDPSSGLSSSTPPSEFLNQCRGFSLSSNFKSAKKVQIITGGQMGGASGGFWCSLLCADEQAPRWIRNVAKQPHVWMECKGRRTKKVIELVQENVKSGSIQREKPLSASPGMLWVSWQRLSEVREVSGFLPLFCRFLS